MDDIQCIIIEFTFNFNICKYSHPLDEYLAISENLIRLLDVREL